MMVIRAGLCAGRHALPVAEYIFEKPLDPTDFAAMREQASLYIRNRVFSLITVYWLVLATKNWLLLKKGRRKHEKRYDG